MNEPKPCVYVRTESGTYLVQVTDPDSQFGFYLADEDQSWDGGIGIAKSWEIVSARSVPSQTRKRLGSLSGWFGVVLSDELQREQETAQQAWEDDEANHQNPW